MKRVLLGASMAVGLVSMAHPVFAASDVKLGLGYFRPEAPVGGRAWVTEKLAVDLGVGFDAKEYTTGPDKTETKTAFTVDAGVPLAVAGDETTRFFVRPGVTFNSTPVWDAAAADPDWVNATQFWVSGSLGVEHFFSKWFSIQAAHGVRFKSLDPGVEGSDTSTAFDSEAFGVSSVGFHFYFVN